MDTQPVLSFDESVAQVMQTLPPVIRAYLAQGTYTTVAKGLMAKYGLRIDQGGVLEREIMLLLMGIENPDDFTKSLATEAQLDQKTIGNIVQDINAQIFVPLREAEMKGQSAPQPARPPSVGVPNYAPPRAVPQASYAPPPQSPSYRNQDTVSSLVRRVQPNRVNAPPPPPSISVIKPPPAPPRPSPQPLPAQPTSSVQPPPPPNLPGALPPKSDIIPPAPKASAPSADPYRESFD